MRNAIISLAALAAPLVAASTQTSSNGGALIINKCDIDIPLEVVPASGSDVDTADATSTTLKAGDVGSSSQFFTNWVSLGDNGGWSLKLNALGNWDNIMQYEYTWTGDNNVWYDMSFVNGVASDFPEWEFLAGEGSTGTSNAYMFATDDQNGMNPAVATSVTVTLVLCPASAGAVQATSAATSPAANEVTTSAAPAQQTTTLETSYAQVQHKEVTEAPVAAPTTTAAAAPSEEAEYEVVTAFATEVVTAVVYETAHAKARRHEHRHPHGHHH